MYKIINESDYNAQVEDWKKRVPAKDWEDQFDRLIDINLCNKRILDCGCGFGHYVSYFTKRNAEVVGIDRELRCLKEARKIKPGYSKIIYGNIEDIEKTYTKFDIIFLRYVIHHIHENKRNEILSLLFNLLKSNGVLIMETAFEEQFLKHYDHKIFPKLTKVLTNIYPKKEELFSSLNIVGFKEIEENEFYLNWDEFQTIDDLIQKSSLLVERGLGPTSWLLLSKEDRVLFHNQRKNMLIKLFPNNIVPKYWFSSVIIAKK